MTVHVFDQIQSLLSSEWSSWCWFCCWWPLAFTSTVRYWHTFVVQTTDWHEALSLCLLKWRERSDAGSHICVLSCVSRPPGGRTRSDEWTLSWFIIKWVFLQLNEGRLERKELREQSSTSKKLISHPDGFITHNVLDFAYFIRILHNVLLKDFANQSWLSTYLLRILLNFVIEEFSYYIRILLNLISVEFDLFLYIRDLLNLALAAFWRTHSSQTTQKHDVSEPRETQSVKQAAVNKERTHWNSKISSHTIYDQHFSFCMHIFSFHMHIFSFHIVLLRPNVDSVSYIRRCRQLNSSHILPPRNRPMCCIWTGLTWRSVKLKNIQSNINTGEHSSKYKQVT